MSEQKHTPGPWKSKNKSVYIDPKVEANPFNQWIAECRNTEDAELIARAPELLQQVAELTKENEDLTAWQTTATNVLKMSGEIKVKLETENKALTEQVENLKADANSVIEDLQQKTLEQAEELSRLREEVEKLKGFEKMIGAHQSHIDQLAEKNSRLREREKELLEALRKANRYVIEGESMFEGATDAQHIKKEFQQCAKEVQSLLSKFEVHTDI